SVCAALVTTTAACTHNDPTPSPATTTATSTPTPTPTPTPTLTLSAEQQQIEDAKAAYKTYRSTTNEVEQAGMADWRERILPLVGGDMREKKVSFYEQAEQQGLRQTGEIAIAGMTVIASTDRTVTLEVCHDNTGADLVNPAGESVLLAGYASRLISTIEMFQQDDGRWTVNSGEADEERPC
ncbi:MAG TPA: hypothetical protein VFC06_01005, partial [Demequina sp.]|nr:hypothetical protein [Demequina sp.]